MSNKHNAIVELLLDNENIDVNCRDNQGNTPLHAAVEVGDIADGDVDDDAFFMTITGHQYHPRQQGGQRLWCEPATEAQEHGQPQLQVVQLLSRLFCSWNFLTTMMMMTSITETKVSRNGDGQTPLMFAVGQGGLDCAR